MAFADDVAIKAAALEARAAALEAGVKQAAMQAMNPPPQAEYDTAALLARIEALETAVEALDGHTHTTSVSDTLIGGAGAVATPAEGVNHGHEVTISGSVSVTVDAFNLP